MRSLNAYEITSLLMDLIEEAANNEFLKDELKMSAELPEQVQIPEFSCFVLKINGREYQINVARIK